MTIQSQTDTLRAAAVALMAVAQIVTAPIPFVLGWPNTVASRAFEYEHLLIPATYAFSIWGVIFLWSLGLSVWGWLNRRSPVVRETAWPIATVFACNAVWQIWVPLNGLGPVSLVIIIAGLLAAITAMFRLRAHDPIKWQTWAYDAPVQLLSGWLTAAAFVNIASTLVWSGEGFRPTREEVAVIILGALIVFAAFLTVMTASLAYAAAIVWALTAIAFASIYDNRPLLWGTAGAGVLLTLLLLYAASLNAQSFRRRQG